MKTIIILLLLPLSMLGQQMIGIHYSDVMEIENAKMQTSDVGDHYITSTGDDIYWVYYFNDADYCFATLLFPLSYDMMYAIIELFNDQYIVVSDTQWKIYSRGIVIDVTLDKDDDGIYFFMYMSGSIRSK